MLVVLLGAVEFGQGCVRGVRVEPVERYQGGGNQSGGRHCLPILAGRWRMLPFLAQPDLGVEASSAKGVGKGEFTGDITSGGRVGSGTAGTVHPCRFRRVAAGGDGQRGGSANRNCADAWPPGCAPPGGGGAGVMASHPSVTSIKGSLSRCPPRLPGKGVVAFEHVAAAAAAAGAGSVDTPARSRMWWGRHECFVVFFCFARGMLEERLPGSSEKSSGVKMCPVLFDDVPGDGPALRFERVHQRHMRICSLEPVPDQGLASLLQLGWTLGGGAAQESFPNRPGKSADVLAGRWWTFGHAGGRQALHESVCVDQRRQGGRRRGGQWRCCCGDQDLGGIQCRNLGVFVRDPHQQPVDGEIDDGVEIFGSRVDGRAHGTYRVPRLRRRGREGRPF